MSADGLLEIFFSCKERKHMGHVVLIADVSFFNIMKNILSSFSWNRAILQPILFTSATRDNISFDMSSPFPADAVGLLAPRNNGFQCFGGKVSEHGPQQNTGNLRSFVKLNFSLPLQLENKLKR